MAKQSFFFDFDNLTPHLEKYLPAVEAGVDLALDAAVPQAETYMRENAPWTDRTGNARNGLRAQHNKEPFVQHELILYHTMPYGIWLEVRWSGRYAIIAPTIKKMGPEVMAMVAASVGRAIKLMGGGP
jgi:hypothetical protein